MSNKGKRSRFINKTGMRFGRLLVLSEAAMRPPKVVYWKCRCDCGKEIEAKSGHLSDGNIKSCGCLRLESCKTSSITHGDHRSAIYTTWRGIKGRVFRKNFKFYPNYGGRGIKMHEPWIKDFVAFRDYILATIGERPEGMSIDRIDNNGHYEPGNLRWADQTAQGANQRTNLHLTANGETKILVQWARQFGITPAAIRARLARGQSFQFIADHYTHFYKPSIRL